MCARPRNAIAAMHQDTKSSPAGMLMPIGRPADSTIISTKIATMKRAGEIAGEQIEPIEKNAHDGLRASGTARMHRPE